MRAAQALPGCIVPDGGGAAGQSIEHELVETDIAIGPSGARMVATLALPDGEPAPVVVLLLHGYTGTRHEFAVAGGRAGLFDLAARRLARFGIASLRIDFRGSGDSDGTWRETTFTRQADDVLTAIGAIRSMPGLAESEIVLLGFSQGGLVALRALDLGAKARAAVLWNPVLDPRHTFASILGEGSIRQGVRLSFEGRDTELVKGTRLNAAFFRDVVEINPIADGRSFRGPLLVVTGSHDRTAAAGPELAMLLKRARRSRPTEIVVLDADHGFNAGVGTATIDTVIGCSIAFLSGL